MLSTAGLAKNWIKNPPQNCATTFYSPKGFCLSVCTFALLCLFVRLLFGSSFSLSVCLSVCLFVWCCSLERWYTFNRLHWFLSQTFLGAYKNGRRNTTTGGILNTNFKKWKPSKKKVFKCAHLDDKPEFFLCCLLFYSN